MKKTGLITAIFSSLIFGLLVGKWLLPSVPFWKILLLLIIPGIIFFIFYKYKQQDNHFELLNGLLKNIEEGNWEENNREFIILKKANPVLAEQLLKMQHIYQANKQFTQNAAHELQTPLAIIKGHAELLLQSPSLSENEAEAIGTILQNINRLSRLNSSLILLTKIEHGRFADEEMVNLTELVETALVNFTDMIELQGLSIERLETVPFWVKMSATLAEILVANLLQNAIRHNLPNGFIKIESDDNGLVISNSGRPLEISTDQLFKRFYRESKAEEGLGLGLSIVKRIVGQNGLEVGYGYLNGVHSVRITQKN